MTLAARYAPASEGKSPAIIARQSGHLARLTDDLLDAGRALLGKIELKREPVELAHAVAATLSTLKASGRTKCVPGLLNC